VAAILAGLVAGCGSATVTTTQTVVHTRTVPKVVRAPARTVTVVHTVTVASAGSSTSAAGASAGSSTSAADADAGAGGYSSAFASEFTSLCISKLGDRSACGCALRYIEANVPYAQVKAAEGDLSSGARPSWYYGAVAACI
jgi:hypothetical protein